MRESAEFGALTRIDCQALGGVAGDMFAAALFDAFPALYTSFKEDLSRLNVEGIDATLSKQTSHSLYAQGFSVSQTTDIKPPRTRPAVTEFLQQKTLSQDVVNVAVDIYRLLAEAEAAVHGKSVETVHFHEVSDWDSMIDIVAAAGIIVRLNCPCWRIGPLPLGGGTITTAHGDIPLPAPATLHLLQGYDWIDDGQPGERVTPTGAAIIAYLKPTTLRSVSTAAALTAVGVGSGTRQLKDRANIFRVCVFNDSATDQPQTDLVCHLAFEIDDMTGEELAQATALLRSQSGVLDVSTVAMQGKKGRSTTGVRILVKPTASGEVIDQCFLQTSTLGVRCAEVSRTVLQRQQTAVDGSQVKVAQRPGDFCTAKVESDELVQIDNLNSRRLRAQQLEKKAVE